MPKQPTVTDEQPCFDFVIPAKPVFTLRELVPMLGLSLETIWRLWDSGQLGGNSHNTNRDEQKKKRYHHRVRRESLIAYLTRTASYDEHMQFQWAKETAEPLNRLQTQRLIDHLHQQLYKK